MDYLSPLYQETSYCLGVERLLDIEEQIPERASVIRVMMLELNRISSHLVCLATGGMEIGALTVMTIGFREREMVLDVFETITGQPFALPDPAVPTLERIRRNLAGYF
jgi:NADH-quinone oxidoreductase subunit D